MKATIKIPSPLRRFTEQAAHIELDATNVEDALSLLNQQYPDIKNQLLDENGQLRNFVNIFYNKTDIRQQQGMATKLTDNCELRIVPAIAGGLSGGETWDRH